MNEFALDSSNMYRKAYYDKRVTPYVILSNIQLNPILNNSGYAFKASIVIDIVTRFTTSSWGTRLLSIIC